jgi:hypothetical protein
MTGSGGIVVARRDPGGMVTIAARAYMAIPAALRRRCGMRAGDRVLLAAAPGEDTLTAYPLAMVDQAIREHRRVTGGSGERRAGAAGPDGPVPRADLLSAPAQRRQAPTFAEYVPLVSRASSAGSRRAYGTYWNRITDRWGHRRLDEPTPSGIRQLMADVRDSAVQRRNGRGGRSAAEHLVAALRCVYRHAASDGYITEADNPALKVAKPRRLPSPRSALPAGRLAEVNQVAATTGDDPELDTLLLRLHTETACRRGGALALRTDDLDPGQCLIRLREKGGTVRWQPVSPTLMARLAAHAREQHAPPGEQLLRYTDGRPPTGAGLALHQCRESTVTGMAKRGRGSEAGSR